MREKERRGRYVYIYICRRRMVWVSDQHDIRHGCSTYLYINI